MSDERQLRLARVDDASEIARLAGELGYAASAETVRQRLFILLPHPDHRMAVVAGHGGLHGCIAVERRHTLESGERIEIVGLVVDSRSRGGGVGRLLVSEAEQWAQQRGFHTVSVRSNIVREASHPFYEQLGYVRRKTQHFYAKDLP